MTSPNYYDLSSETIRIGYYPRGQGGPVHPSGGEGPTLVYTDAAGNTAKFNGKELTVTPLKDIGQLVSALVKTSGIVPGGVVALGVLIPDVDTTNANHVAVKTYAFISTHRGTSHLGPGQLETYASVPLTGSAANIIQPL